MTRPIPRVIAETGGDDYVPPVKDDGPLTERQVEFLRWLRGQGGHVDLRIIPWRKEFAGNLGHDVNALLTHASTSDIRRLERRQFIRTIKQDWLHRVKLLPAGWEATEETEG